MSDIYELWKTREGRRLIRYVCHWGTREYGDRLLYYTCMYANLGWKDERIVAEMAKLKIPFVREDMVRAKRRVGRVCKLIPPTRDIKYTNVLDYGCFHGYIAQELGVALKAKSIYGADVVDQVETEIKYIHPDQLQSTTLRFDVITCMMTLHHIEELSSTLKLLESLLKPRGYLVIREHNVSKDNKDLERMLNMLHKYKEEVYLRENHASQHYIQYTSEEELRNIIKDNCTTLKPHGATWYEENSPIASYWIAYQRSF